MDEIIALTSLDEKRYNAARQRITAFHKRFGEGHLYLAYHAAFPMALTPDLLYRLRANFQLDNNKQFLKIRWIAVADLLLSNLCEEVEYELYQMKADVRSVLLHDLKNDPKFGSKRITELASFLLDYVEQQMNNEAPALVQVQRWMALPYLDPTRAAHELASALQEKLRQNNRGEILRMASLVETFADPLKEMLPEYMPLVVYAQNAIQVIRGEGKSAVVQTTMEMGQVQATRVFGVDLSVPEQLRQTSMFISANHLERRLPPQQKLHNDQYLIVDTVGQGGMGAVYEAVDVKAQPKRRVAIKEMSQSQLKTPADLAAARKRFKGEANMLRALDHPNLPDVYDSFEEHGRWYLVMEFIEGQTLLQLLQAYNGRPLPLEHVLDYACQLCSVLDYLHRQYPPIIFRDLKPSNVMVTAGRHVYLIDFGIVRFFKDGQAVDTASFITKGYAPPEQYQGATSPRSDLFSLGATLHTCLTAHYPASNTPTLFDFPPLCQRVPSAPKDLERLLIRLLKFKKSQRPSSAEKVRQELVKIIRQTTKEEPKPPQMRQKNFFISYHNADRAWAEWIAWHLEEVGYSVLLRVWNFQPDANSQEEMALASQEAECMIVLFSQDYLNALSSMPSDWRTSLLLSPNRHIVQLSVRVDDCNPDILGAIDYVDLVGLDESSAREQLLSLVRSESAEVVSQLGSFTGIEHFVAEQPQFPGTLDAGEAERTIEVFFSYSHKDQHLRNQLETHLNLLQGLGLIADWYDHKIGPGQEWADQINAHVRTAQIILLLISPDFIASPYCYDVEMKIALERHERGEARVILILLRPVDLEGTPFAKLRVLPSNGRPLTAWRNRDKAFLNIVRGIQNTIEELTRRPLASSSTSEQGLEELQKTDDSPDNSSVIVASNADEALWEELIDAIQLNMQPSARAMATASTLRQLSKLIPTDVTLADLIVGWRTLSHATHQEEEPATVQRRATCGELADLASQFTVDQGNLVQAIKTWQIWLDAFANSGDPRQAAMTKTFRRELLELQGPQVNLEENLQELLATDLDRYFSILVKSHQETLYKYSLLLLNSTEDAQDIVQDVFLSVYKTLKKRSAESIRELRLEPWLRVATRNACFKFLRRKRLKTVSINEQEEDNSLLNLSEGDIEQPEVVLENVESQQEILDLMLTLPEKYRVPLFLYSVDGLSIRDIAKLLDQRETSVRTYISQGRKLLREALKSETKNEKEI